jgi:hypothetical protein
MQFSQLLTVIALLQFINIRIAISNILVNISINETLNTQNLLKYQLIIYISIEFLKAPDMIDWTEAHNYIF